MEEARIYHFIPESDFHRCDGGPVIVDSLQTEGFIHCSTREQVVEIANRLFPGRKDILILTIDATRLTARVIYENLEGGARLFPHIYGAIDRDVILSVRPFNWTGDSFVLPF